MEVRSRGKVKDKRIVEVKGKKREVRVGGVTL